MRRCSHVREQGVGSFRSQPSHFKWLRTSRASHSSACMLLFPSFLFSLHVSEGPSFRSVPPYVRVVFRSSSFRFRSHVLSPAKPQRSRAHRSCCIRTFWFVRRRRLVSSCHLDSLSSCLLCSHPSVLVSSLRHLHLHHHFLLVSGWDWRRFCAVAAIQARAWVRLPSFFFPHRVTIAFTGTDLRPSRLVFFVFGSWTSSFSCHAFSSLLASVRACVSMRRRVAVRAAMRDPTPRRSSLNPRLNTCRHAPPPSGRRNSHLPSPSQQRRNSPFGERGGEKKLSGGLGRCGDLAWWTWGIDGQSHDGRG